MGVAFFKKFCILLKMWFLIGISAKKGFKGLKSS